MKTLNTIFSLLAGAYLMTQVACTESEKPKEPEKTYVYSELVDRLFKENNVPLDSVKAYQMSIEAHIFDGDGWTYEPAYYKAADIVQLYEQGITPAVANKYEGITVPDLFVLIENKIPPEEYNTLNKDLRFQLGARLLRPASTLLKSHSASEVNKQYSKFVQVKEDWTSRNQDYLDSFMYMIGRNISPYALKKYNNLNKTYGTNITIKEAIDFEIEKTPFKDITRLAKEHHRLMEQERKGIHEEEIRQTLR